MSEEPENYSPQASPPWLKLVLPAIVVVLGVVFALWIMRSGPQAKPRPKARMAPLVEVRQVSTSSPRAMLTAMGTVKPSREIQLKPQVSGRIIDLDPGFLPGGSFRAGQQILLIDPADYRLAVDQLASDVARAETELRLEQGNQLVAQKEYELFGHEASAAERDLLLRQPQLESLEAALAAAKARLQMARLDLERTRVLAPFNAVVADREVNLGANVNENTTLASLIGTDAYWIEASVPVSQLRWIRIPQHNGDDGSKVRVFDEAAWGTGVFREGRVVRLAAKLEEQGRMARLLVRVEDPLSLQTSQRVEPQLMVDSYVRTEIEGRTVDSVIAIDRDELRDGETVWVLSPGGTLEIREVEIVFRGREQLLVSAGLADGDRLVTSALPAPVAGMSLRVNESEESPRSEGPRKAGGAQ